MQTLDVIRAIYDYNEWANNGLLAACENLTPEQFSQPQGVSWGSIETDLAHVMAAQVNWLSRWRTGANARATTEVQQVSGLANVRRAFDESHAALREYIEGLSDERLARPLAFRDSSGNAYERVLWQLLIHVANHGTYHRGEIAAALTSLGHDPGDLDYVYFEMARDGERLRT